MAVGRASWLHICSKTLPHAPVSSVDSKFLNLLFPGQVGKAGDVRDFRGKTGRVSSQFLSRWLAGQRCGCDTLIFHKARAATQVQQHVVRKLHVFPEVSERRSALSECRTALWEPERERDRERRGLSSVSSTSCSSAASPGSGIDSHLASPFLAFKTKLNVRWIENLVKQRSPFLVDQQIRISLLKGSRVQGQGPVRNLPLVITA